MRVIAGSAKRMQLKTLAGLDTRPTTDRIKETLFNMLQADLPDASFLDLFSGSGGIGIEALSRGASSAVFIEHNPQAIACIKENLQKTKLAERAEVLNCSVTAGIHKLMSQNHCFDLIFMDPPYQEQLEQAVLMQLKDSAVTHADTKIIIEAALDTRFDYLASLGYQVIKEKCYKTNKHLFLEKEK